MDGYPSLSLTDRCRLVPARDKKLAVLLPLLVGRDRRKMLVSDLDRLGRTAEFRHLRFELAQGRHGVAERKQPDRNVDGAFEQPVDHRRAVPGRER